MEKGLAYCEIGRVNKGFFTRPISERDFAVG